MESLFWLVVIFVGGVLMLAVIAMVFHLFRAWDGDDC